MIVQRIQNRPTATKIVSHDAAWSPLPQNLRQKLLKAQGNIAIPILIILLKHIRHPFQDDAALHKEIKTHLAFARFIIRRVQHLHKSRGEAVAKGYEGVGVLVEGDGPAGVFIKAVEEGAPGGEEGP